MKQDTPDPQTLLFLKTLIEEQNLSATAVKLGLSTPGASRLLAELRSYFDDELFVRSRTGLLPTQRAINLLPLIENVLNAYEMLRPKELFNIAQVRKQVRIGCVDNALFSVCPHVLRAVHTNAPNISLDFQPIDDSRFDALKNGRLDLLITPIENFPNDDFHSLDLKNNEFCICCGTDHPLFIQQQIDQIPTKTESILQYAFIDISFQPYRRNTITLRELIYPDFSTAPSAAQTRFFLPMLQTLFGTQLLMVTSKTTAQELIAKTHPCEFGILQTEVKGRSNTAKLVWHRRTHLDPVMQWVRGTIVKSAHSNYPTTTS